MSLMQFSAGKQTIFIPCFTRHWNTCCTAVPIFRCTNVCRDKQWAFVPNSILYLWIGRQQCYLIWSCISRIAHPLIEPRTDQNWRSTDFGFLTPLPTISIMIYKILMFLQGYSSIHKSATAHLFGWLPLPPTPLPVKTENPNGLFVSSYHLTN